MAVDGDYLDFVLDQLSLLPDVRSRRMFGAVGLYCGEHFFAILDDDTLYLKVDDGNRADFEAAGMGPFRPYPDRDETMSYYEVPADVLEDSETLAGWALKAVEVARRKPARKRRRR